MQLVRHTDLQTSICCFLSDIQCVFFHPVVERNFVLWCQPFSPPQERSICCVGTPWLLGRYPASSTRPPGMIPAVFWPQNHAEQLVLSSVMSLPTIINWCVGEITKRDFYFWLALNGIKYLQPLQYQRTQRRGEKKKKKHLWLALLNLERFLDQS